MSLSRPQTLHTAWRSVLLCSVQQSFFGHMKFRVFTMSLRGGGRGGGEICMIQKVSPAKPDLFSNDPDLFLHSLSFYR